MVKLLRMSTISKGASDNIVQNSAKENTGFSLSPLISHSTGRLILYQG